MPSEERAHDAFEFFLRHGWVKERDRKAVTDGIECALRAAEQEAAAREREACAKIAISQLGSEAFGAASRIHTAIRARK